MSSDTISPGSILGNRVQRTEDPDLLRGTGRYLDDLQLPGATHAVFARSEVAHATIRAIHIDDAVASPGVLAVFTAADLGVAPHHGFAKVHDDFARPPLADGIVRAVGEPIAVVIADTFTAATDAAATIWAEVDELPAAVDPIDALAADAPVIFAAHGSNQAVVSIDPEVDLEALAEGGTVVRGTYVNQRVAVAPMEPSGCAAVPGDDGRLTFYASNQFPHNVAENLTKALGREPGSVRVITPQVGGGFGGKAGVAPEYTVVAAAALQVGRPVTWHATRSEDLLSLPHSRAQVQYAELAVRPDGTFAALRVQLVGDAGSYPTIGAFLPAGTKRMSHGTYNFDAIQFDVAVAVTNTNATGAYRGAGRPEATALLERLVDQAAIETGIDPIEIRRRNLIADDAFPFTTITGMNYDTGRYQHPLDVLTEVSGYADLRAEQAARRERGDTLQLGIGVAAYVEITAGGDAGEFAAVDVHRDGSATVRVGTLSSGQGHQTAFATLVHAATGIPLERIELVQGDTDLVPRGGGTGGSRSLQIGGSAVRGASEALVDKARQLAATMLEADIADVVLDVGSGTFSVAGVPAISLTWADLATRAADDGVSNDGLTAESIFSQDGATFPFGAHLAVVEVDTDTGAVRLLRHVAVDDCGTVLNPLLLEGQQHGGIGSGAGQALFEEVRYDDAGTPLTTTFADYALPSAAELPSFEAHSTETPTPLNPLGAKGIGEAATIGSTPAVQNAVIDAVQPFGVRHLDMPCTAERVWQAIDAGRRGTPPDPWREPPEVFARLRAADAGSTVTEEGLDAAEGI